MSGARAAAGFACKGAGKRVKSGARGVQLPAVRSPPRAACIHTPTTPRDEHADRNDDDDDDDDLALGDRS